MTPILQILPAPSTSLVSKLPADPPSALIEPKPFIGPSDAHITSPFRDASAMTGPPKDPIDSKLSTDPPNDPIELKPPTDPANEPIEPKPLPDLPNDLAESN